MLASCDLETLYERMLPEGTVEGALLSKLRNAELYQLMQHKADEFGFKFDNLDYDWEVTLWGRNMLDEEYYSFGIDIPTIGGYAGVVAPMAGGTRSDGEVGILTNAASRSPRLK